MKLLGLLIFFGVCLLLSARADLTMIQKVEGVAGGGEMTMKIKGDKVRIEISPQMATIFDAKTGDLITLVNDQKTVMRIPAAKMKDAAEMIGKLNQSKGTAQNPRLVPTGNKEKINGYETEQYIYDGPSFKATYWIAPTYPDGAAILKQLQSIKPEVWNVTNMKAPDYRDFPGLPIRTRITMVKAHEGTAPQNAGGGGMEITTTLISAKQDPVDDAEFAVPPDFHEINLPDIFGGKKAAPSDSPSP